MRLTTLRALSTLVVVAGIGAATLAASAQSTLTPLPERSEPPSTIVAPRGDLEFSRFAGASNTAEIDAAKLALRRSRNALVRTYAQRMIDDHTSAQVALQAATRGTGFPPAPVRSVDAEGAAMLETISGEQGPVFDADYMLGQIAAHRKAVANLTWEVENGRINSLKEYASKSLPAVKMHLAMATAFKSSNGATLNAPGFPDVTPMPTASGGPPPRLQNNPAAPTNGQSNQQNSAPGPNPQTGPSAPANVPNQPSPRPTGI